MRQVSAKFVPRLLITSKEQMMTQNLLKNVVTGDEIWVYGYVKTKQSTHWKSPASPHPKKALKICSRVKASVFLNH
jgi:hypothetical protein